MEGRCGLCGRSVSVGAQCVCLTPGFTEMSHPFAHGTPADYGRRVAAALERIASALERLVPDGRHTQQPSRPSTHDHTRVF